MESRRSITADVTAWVLGLKIHPARLVGPDDITRAAQSLGVHPAIIMAFSHQESENLGFLKSGKTRIRFERGKWHKYRPIAIPLPHPPKIFRSDKAEWHWAQFAIATRISLSAAINCTSFGRWQIMGFNHVGAGYPSLYDFYIDMLVSEQKHLDAFTTQTRNSPGLLKAMKKTLIEKPLTLKTCEDLARYYNGSHWREINPEYAECLRYYFLGYFANLSAKMPDCKVCGS